jgi:hypothetical protein
MLSYINAGFGNVLGDLWLDRIYHLGFNGIRQDIDIRWKQVVNELGRYEKFIPIFLFGGSDISGWTPDDFLSYTTLVARHILEKDYFVNQKIYFEIGNEPDIAVREWREDPQKLHTTFWECYHAVKSINKNIEFVTGGISNLNKRGLDWLAEFVQNPLPNNAIIGFHRYPHGHKVETPHNGFDSREHEMNRLRSLSGAHKLMCTETGLSMGPYRVRRGFPLCCLHKNMYISEVTQGMALEHEWNFYRRRGVEGLVWYQLKDGPLESSIQDHFGMYSCCFPHEEKFACEVARNLFK